MTRLIIVAGTAASDIVFAIEKLLSNERLRYVAPASTQEGWPGGSYESTVISEEDWPSEEMILEISQDGRRFGLTLSSIATVSGDFIGVTSLPFAVVPKVRQLRAEAELDCTVLGVLSSSASGPGGQLEDHLGQDQGNARYLHAEPVHVRDADATLVGPRGDIGKALLSIANLLLNRGVLADREICTMIGAGLLLKDADPKMVQAASYDLRLGSEIWCQGSYKKLGNGDPFFKIPPYSYAIASAQETANLPRFIVGKFDLKVSFFFSGLILSNGPQVDPGYSGALFCLLFNSTDQPVSLTHKEHFATIEFQVTNRTSLGYEGQYAHREFLSNFMGQAAGGSGGNIVGKILDLERRSDEADAKIDDRMDRVESATSQARNTLVGSALAVAALIVAVYVPTCTNFENLERRAQVAIERAEAAVEKAEATVDSLPPSERIEAHEDRLESIERLLGKALGTTDDAVASGSTTETSPKND